MTQEEGEQIIDLDSLGDIDSFSKQFAELIVSQQESDYLGKSKSQLEEQIYHNVKSSISESQDLFNRGLEICMNKLTDYEFKRIFVDVLKNFSIEDTPQAANPESALISEDDYQTILYFTDELEDQKLFKDAQSLYVVLMLFAPHDYRAYINYGLSIKMIDGINEAAQFFEVITEGIINPILDYHAAKSALEAGNKPKASELIARAISVAEEAQEQEQEQEQLIEVEEILAGLLEFKNENQL